MLQVRFHAGIGEIAADQWDALRPDDNPFLAHAFLHALEDTGCVRADWGWQPHHLGMYESGELIAAAPLYLKENSHGEFVFDGSWANAWERAGGTYYPKLLNAVPYSPVPGPRLLAREPTDKLQLVAALVAEAERLGLSSVHANFLIGDEPRAFDDAWLSRSDVQFHWHNRDYRHFPDFLATLNHKKRKNIRHERHQVERSELRIEMRSGDTLDPAQWARIHMLYLATFDAKGNHAALTGEFFQRLGSLGSTVQLALAWQADTMVAMALFLQSGSVLYGRYWGAAAEFPGLHFELCYYRGIEHAIAHGLQRFEPGAQGEHKLARGFLPVRTQSRHFLANMDFRAAVATALAREALVIDDYVTELEAHSPYAHGTGGPS